MKLINKVSNKVIGEVTTNHSMTMEEVIEVLDGEIINDMNDERWSDDGDNVIINGNRYWFEDLDCE
jgi:hypothetical protein